jgi:hypothetical protein
LSQSLSIAPFTLPIEFSLFCSEFPCLTWGFTVKISPFVFKASVPLESPLSLSTFTLLTFFATLYSGFLASIQTASVTLAR